MIERNRPVLLIEDNDPDFKLAVRSVRQAGFHHPVLRCSTGREALDYIERRKQFLDAPEPVLILLDLNMPEIDGRRILAELRNCAWLAAVPALVWSASTDPRDVRLCYQLGAAGYFVKPPNLQDFQQMIRRLTTYWLKTVVLPTAEDRTCLGAVTRP